MDNLSIFVAQLKYLQTRQRPLGFSSVRSAILDGRVPTVLFRI